MLCPSNLALFRITEHMVAETTEKFNKVAVPWQKKVKTLEPSELQSAYARLCEIESMVKSQMEVLSRKEESETEKAGTSMKQDHRVVLVLCQSLLFTIPFQLQVIPQRAVRFFFFFVDPDVFHDAHCRNCRRRWKVHSTTKQANQTLSIGTRSEHYRAVSARLWVNTSVQSSSRS